MIKKFIKINLIILVIFCLINSYITIIPYMVLAEEDDENQNSTEETYYDDNDGEDPATENNEEKSMDDLELEKSQLESNIESSNSQIEFLDGEISSTVAEISSYNQQILDMQLEVAKLKVKEKELLVYIKQAEKDIEKSNQKYEKQKNLLEKRMVAMYENGSNTYLDVLLSSKSIVEFFSNYYLITEITEADQELLKSVNDEKNYNIALKETLDNQKTELEEAREEQEKMAILLSNMIVIKNNKVNSLNEQELAVQSQIEEYQNQVNEIETEIRQLALKNIGAKYVGGEMAWPVPGYTRITSPFGMRTHPITGVYKLHTGADIGAPYGATFVAANDGIVTYAGWNNAYGNMVIIDHGGGITTLYGHGSEILVSTGDTVTKGQGVLKVGSTGYSTGPHAHFEVRINGEYVDPLSYITSYTSNSTETENTNTTESNTTNETNSSNDNTNTSDNEVLYFDLRDNN